MYQIDYCPACFSEDLTQRPAYLHQFVAWRALGTDPGANVPTTGLSCNRCNFTFSELRLDANEEANLYKDYRGPEYNTQRIACEPSYAEVMKTFDEETYLKARKFGIDTLIEKHVNKDQIKTILDYGGNKGEHIPVMFESAQRYVYDIGNVELLDGILKFDATRQDTIDFVMCCHVLEHKSEPADLLDALKVYLSPESWLYVEVPEFETYQFDGAVFHEHINSFSDQSMVALMDVCGLTIVDSMTVTYGSQYNMCILAKLK